MPHNKQPEPDIAITLLSRWRQLGESLGLESPTWMAEGKKLLRHWARWPRAYHDLSHLHACLNHLEALQAAEPNAMAEPHTAALAIWFHDAIYWPWKNNNEERSAQWASRFLTAQKLDPATVSRVHRYILDTRHQPGNLTGDARWVVDIDLAILGQSEAVYREFERGVRREYRFVPWARYVVGRTAVLQGFLDRPRLFETDHFAQHLESSARDNLRKAVTALANGKAF